ncbi:MAG TPA: serine/threonine-protein kinase [Ktedonosporobacter sp.]|nr:serine/threonine-protein kinase [Ktedonosporobacter sp.]
MAGLEGRRLDRYELRQVLGRGGMANVYQGYDPHFEREVAIKVFKREDEALLARFIREARLMASLHHAHLLPVYDTGESQLDGVTRYYMVMPLMEGGTLRDRIRRGPLSLKEACSYLRDIASALDYIHAQGIIHRDIKSSNVLLDREGHSYLSDFGIARTLLSESTQLTTAGNVLGTVDYVAPELFEANHRADVRSDLYSLGVLLFEMITGHLPFAADNQLAVLTMQITRPAPAPSSLQPGIAPQIDRVVLKALEKKPEMRYGSAGELADAFCQTIASGSSGIYANPAWAQGEGITVVANKPTAKLILPPPPGPEATPLPTATGYSRIPETRPAPVYLPTTPRTVPLRPRSRARIVTLLALLALLAVLAPIVFVLARIHNTTLVPVSTPTTVSTNQATNQTPTITASPTTATAAASATAGATVTATANATATAQIATATQQANTNATATAGAVATAQGQVTPTVGTPAYKDALNNASNPATQAEQWDQNTTCAFKADGYHVMAAAGVLTPGSLIGCREAGMQYANVAISVDVTILSGATGGLFFHVTPQVIGGAYAGYLLEIDSKGNYRIARSNNFTLGTGTTLLRDWTASTALKMGSGAKNTLEVQAKGGSLSFSINGVFLAPALQDSTFTTGDIGFLATTVGGGASADIAYSNLSVSAL